MTKSLTFLFALACASTGCAAHSPPPLHVRYADIGHGPTAREGQAVVVEFQSGDRIPIELRFSDDAFELSPAAPRLELVAKRQCFILVGADRLRTSLNGQDFDESPKAPGRFRVGLELSRAQRRLVVEVATPVHASGDTAR